jgi:predicted DNA-binding protein
LVSRRTVGMDRDIMERLKEIAKRRGMGISPYLRKLIQEALELEKMGYYAPRALKERRLEIMLEMFNFGYIPLEITSNPGMDARSYGKRLGETLREIGGDVYSVIEYLGQMHKVAIVQDDKITVLTPTGMENGLNRRALIAEILKGMAEGAKLPIKETGTTAIIEMSREMKEELRRRVESEISQTRTRRGI